MKTFIRDSKISKKFLFAFGTIFCCFFVCIILCILSVYKVGNYFNNFYNMSYQVAITQLDMRRSLQSAVKNVLWSCTTSDEEKTQEYIATAENDLKEVEEGIEVLEEKFLGDESLLTNFKEKMTSSLSIKEEVFQEAKTNNIDNSLELFNNKYSPILIEAQKLLKEIGKDVSNRVDENYKKVNRTKLLTLIVLIFISIISLFIIILISIILTKNLTIPITQLETAAKGMAEGNLHTTITYEAKDELGILSKNMQFTMEEMRKIILDIGYCLNGMAEGNLNVRTSVRESYTGDFEPILSNMRDINIRLSNTIGQIKLAIIQVTTGAQNMAEGAQSLAEGATDQASSVEELTAMVGEVMMQAEENAKNAKDGSEKAEHAGKEINETTIQMENMTSAMESISQTSKQIELIISTIEDIATQTNLLSLNAAIEAARAGEAGKGFAVVADEIRQLANQSAEAVTNTRELIQTSIMEVTKGNEIVGQTTSSLQKVIGSMKEILDLVKVIREASERQAYSMTQVNEGIEEISAVVQNTSATAQETSATSEELSAQSESLNQLIEQFTLRQG